jgi:hypothetical protein
MKVIKKSDITTLVESTLKEAGILNENEEMMDNMTEMEDIEENDDIEEGIEDIEESDDVEGMEIEESDVVSESVTKLASEASEHNIISENLKKDVEAFNKIINYKH